MWPKSNLNTLALKSTCFKFPVFNSLNYDDHNKEDIHKTEDHTCQFCYSTRKTMKLILI